MEFEFECVCKRGEINNTLTKNAQVANFTYLKYNRNQAASKIFLGCKNASRINIDNANSYAVI